MYVVENYKLYNSTQYSEHIFLLKVKVLKVIPPKISLFKDAIPSNMSEYCLRSEMTPVGKMRGIE